MLVPCEVMCCSRGGWTGGGVGAKIGYTATFWWMVLCLWPIGRRRVGHKISPPWRFL